MDDDKQTTNGDNGKAIAKATGKDPKTGRFQKGWRGGPGNPNNQKTADFRKVWREANTEADARRAIKILKEKAFSGEQWALLEYLHMMYGTPKQSIDATVVSDNITTITSLLLDDSTPRADMIARIISSRTAALPAEAAKLEQPASLPAPAEPASDK